MDYRIAEEERNIILQLCDIALKAGGLQNKTAVDKIINIFAVEAPLTPEVVIQGK